MDAELTGRCTGLSVAASVRPPSHKNESLIDMTGVNWCDSSGMVGVTVLVQHLVETGRTATVHAPVDAAVANYLARMHLGDVLDGLGATHNLPGVADHDVHSLVELAEFDGAVGATAIANMAHDHLFPADPAAAAVVLSGLGETAENVHEHSGRESGFAAAQRYRDGRLGFAVGDSGIGLLGSLRPYGVNNDAQALRVALRRGGTGSGDLGRGNGLPSVLEQTCDSGGALTVVSGLAGVVVHASGRRQEMDNAISFPGTLIYGVLHSQNGGRS